MKKALRPGPPSSTGAHPKQLLENSKQGFTLLVPQNLTSRKAKGPEDTFYHLPFNPTDPEGKPKPTMSPFTFST